MPFKALVSLALSCVLLFVSAATPASKSSPECPEKCDISIIGAGIGGVYSAWRLAVDSRAVPGSRICIFEAKKRIGGRILTVRDPIPGFEGYAVDLGAYRFHRLVHRHTKLLTEDKLGIKTLCYTDPLDRRDFECGANVRQIVTTRGRTYGQGQNGTNADDAFKEYSEQIPYVINQEYQWGPDRPLKQPRGPRDFLSGSNSIIPEVGAAWQELIAETDYVKAMRLVDRVLLRMKNGTYRGIPYSEISVLQAARLEGLTQEEVQLSFDTAYDVGENYRTRHSIEHQAQLLLRAHALRKVKVNGPRSLATPVEFRDGIPRRIGMVSILEEMLKACQAAGVRIFYGSKVTRISRKASSSSRLVLTFLNRSTVQTGKVIANIGKPDLIALGVDSEPLKGSSEDFKRAVERNFVVGLSKTYCFWEDAWWLTKLKTAIGRTRTHGEPMFSARYHDGHFTCTNGSTLTGCRGGMLVSYDLGDYTEVATAIYAHNHNRLPYTPITNSDNMRRLIPGNMTEMQQLHFDDLYRQIKRVHKSSLEAKGYDVEEVIRPPAGCIYADWRDVGVHATMGPGKGPLNEFALFTKPVPDLSISLVNEAWGQVQGWAEASLNSAERALYHQYGLARPDWMDGAFHFSIIQKYNNGD